MNRNNEKNPNNNFQIPRKTFPDSTAVCYLEFVFWNLKLHRNLDYLVVWD